MIIDGYNLIGIQHGNLEKEREMLINSLVEYRRRKGHAITIVFDGWKSGEATESRSVIGGVTVIYSRIGEKADSVIKRIVSSEKREWIVVTSDRDIADHAWSVGSIPIPSEAFLGAIQRKASYTSDEEEECREYSRRGNPRQLSKKDKSIQRALSKL